jgi:Zn-dependent protease
MPLEFAIFLIAILIMSVVIHEVAHGVSANALGDPTARLQGRLTLNPLKHLDPVGSVLLPAILALTSAPFLFGWARPVPYNPYNFQRGGRWAEALVAGAGPATNILLALVFAVMIRVAVSMGVSPATIDLAFLVVLVNVMLAIFNMIPIPPLDGSKILDALLPSALSMQYARVRNVLEYNPFLGFGIIIVFVLLFGRAFGQFIYSFAHMLAGI